MEALPCRSSCSSFLEEGFRKGLRLTVTGVPLPPTALSWPEARLTPAREAPAMVTGLEVEVPAMELLAATVFTRVAGVRVEGEETSEEPATCRWV